MSHPNSNAATSTTTTNGSTKRSPTMPHSEPIPIGGSFRNRNRQRSASLSSGSSITSSGSDLPPSPVNSNSPNGTSPRVGLPSPGTSPILSYFLAQSPTKSGNNGGSLPFRSNFASNPVFEEEEAAEVPAAAHARRASTIAAGRFANGGHNPAPVSPSTDKGSGLLRRLSLGSAAFAKPLTDTTTTTATRDDGFHRTPVVPPNSAVATEAPTPLPAHHTKPKRSATVSIPARPRRAPSPMGERILKGHFDGFN